MPAINSRKEYVENSYYHIYNRGVEKREIFQDEQDYSVFLSYLKEYLLPKNESKLNQSLADEKLNSKEKDRILKLFRLNNFADELSLIAYCLMPNHYHLLVRQTSAQVIDKFMNSLATRYTMFFNRKYKRVGPLYQGVYKAVLVTSNEQLLHLSRYIHRNPLKLASQGVALRIQPSSLPEFLGSRKTDWIKPKEILEFFSTHIPNLSYKAFLEQEQDNDLEILKGLILDH